MNGPLGDYCSHGQMRGLGRIALARRALAGDPGWRGPHRHRGHRRAHGRLLRQRQRLARAVGLRLAGLRARRFDLRRPRHRRHRQPRAVPLRALADPGQQRGLRGRGGLHRRSREDCRGTTQITRSPDRLRIRELVAQFVRDSGIMRDGFSFQAGAGGIALAFVDYLPRMMSEAA